MKNLLLLSLAFTLSIWGNMSFGQSITVTSPNGGELVSACSDYTITWNQTGVSNYYNIEYSVDNGSNWITVASSYNTLSNSFTWEPPNISTNSALIRVSDAQNLPVSDVSDALFTINAALTIADPNGGETFETGESTILSYLYLPGIINTVKAEYSIDNGTNWNLISSGNTADGSIDWTIPNDPSTNVKIKLTDMSSPGCKTDTSDAPFTILSEIQTTMPNGGEVWKATVKQQNIPNAIVYASNATLELNTANYTGTTTPYTQTLVPDNPLNKLRIQFTQVGGGYVRVYNGPSSSYPLLGTFYSTGTAISTHYTGALTVVSSLSSGTFDAFVTSVGTTTQTINWDITGTSEYFDIDYSTDNGVTWHRIVNDYPQSGNFGSYDWQVPNVPTTQALIRVVDSNNGSVIDQSDSPFTIEAADPVIIVETPDGGEQYYPTTTPTVRWLSAFTGANVQLEYSVDNGSTWSLIESSYPDQFGGLVSTEGVYSWTVPNTPTTDALFKVTDASNATVFDSSNAVFTIRPHVEVTSPNGGESWERCTTKSITWVHGGTSGTFQIEYSEDGGTTWNTITTTATGTSYSWLLPNITSSQVQVRVSDVADLTKTDLSDANFDVTPPASPVSIIEPNGGQTFITGTVENITYNSPVSNVRLLYSVDNGVTWTTIVNSTSGPAGSYAWTVPNTPTTEALIRIENTSNACDYDESDAVFTIGSSVEVSAPNGGETWQATVVEQTIPNATVQASNATLVLNTVNYTGNTSSYTQTLVPDNPLNKLRIQFTQVGGGYVRVYNGPSSSYPLLGTYYSTGTATSTHYTGAITVVGSLSSGTFDAFVTSVGTPTQNITWDITGTSEYFDIDYSTDNGTTWKRIVNDYRQTGLVGSYDWQVPNVTTTQALIRVTDANNGVVVDQSDATFTINPADPVYVIETPDGGEQYFPTTTPTVRWLSAFTGPNVGLDYSIDSGATWLPVVASYPDHLGGLVATEGTYSWTVPNTPSTNALYRVSDASNALIQDTSNAVFTIKPHIDVTSPNGGESWERCTTKSITWGHGGTSGTFQIEYSEDGGTTWNTITTTATGTSYSWLLPNITSSQVQVRVSDVADLAKTDVSDANFDVTPPASPVSIIEPNGGQTFIAGTVENITYSSPVSNVRLLYSVDNGVTWTTIVNSTSGPAGSYAWTVPNMPTTEALIRIENTSNACDYDESDAVFTIGSSVQVSAPNGGEAWQATVGEQSIPNATVQASNATLVLNTVNYTGNTSSYTQTLVPDNPLNKLRIQFTQVGGGYVRVYNGPSSSYPLLGTYYSTGTATSTHYTGAITVVGSLSSGTFDAFVTSVGTPTQNITWDITGTSEYFDIDYSTDNGTTWKRIVNDYRQTGLVGSYDWQVPNATTTQALIRVVDANNGVVVDQSDATFTINPADPVYVIETPNGGEQYFPTTSPTVRWLSAFTGPNVGLDYSIDSGATWLPVVASYPDHLGGLVATEGTYSWTVPNTPSTNALYRVSDASNALIQDTSNAVFTIKPHIDITSPNGGESWERCTTKSITWGHGGTSGTFQIEYSEDGGTTWNTITTTATGTSYSWLLPNISSSQVQVRVSDVADLAKTDVSDANFDITPPASPVLVIEPNGGQTFIAGTVENITYSSPVSNVRLLYSVDNGVTWTTIVNSTSGPAGSYAWTVPNTPTTEALIRIENTSNACDYDESDAVFTIGSSVQVSAPNGGEAWQATVGEQSIPNATVQASNATLVLNTVNYTGNTSSYTQTLVPDNPLNKLRIQFTQIGNGYVRVYNGPSSSYPLLGTYYTTGTATSTHYTGAITVVGSLSSGTFDAFVTSVGTPTQNITWDITGTSEYFDIDYSTDNGTTWKRIVNDYRQTGLVGSYDWQVPNATTTQALIRVVDANNGVVVDQSDATFTINPADPVYVIETPDGGEQYFPTTTPTVRWLSAFTGPNVGLDYSIDSGATWLPVVASYPDHLGGLVATEGTYSWTVPNTPSTNALYRVSDASNALIQDTSNAVFTIKPHIDITSPNGGESWERCTTKSITWGHGGTSGTFQIEYSEDGGTTWNTITTTATGTSYSWLLPNITSSQVQVRVSDVADLAKTDVSDANFDVTPPSAPVSIIEPNGGQTWIAGTVENITYNSPVSNVRLLYSVDNGVTWTTIVNSTSGPAGSYAWTVPNMPTTEALIRIENTSNACDYDESDAVFTIGSSVQVSAPNGGEAWQATVGEQTIPNATVQASNATLVLNTVNYTGNTSSYTQTLVPDNPLNKLRIQFTQVGGGYVRVYNGPSSSYPLLGTYYSTGTATSTHYTGAITVVSSLSSGTFDAFVTSVGTPTQNITWDITGTSEYFDIDYSTDNGTTWKRIVNDYRQTGLVGSYDWQVPNATTTQALIRVVDANNGVVVDQSDATFTINPADPVYVIETPNGGEQYFPTTSPTVRWLSAFTGPNVGLDYSIDSGATWLPVVASYPDHLGGLVATEGTYSWTVPNTPSTNAMYRVSDASNALIQDTSDAIFTIRPHVEVTSPNGGESWERCTTKSITWVHGGTSGTFQIEYSEDGGTTWNTITTTATGTSYSWLLPNIASSQVQVRVSDMADLTKSDVSDANFDVTPPASPVSLIQPNGGQTLIAGTVENITYSSPVSNVRLLYSVDNGVTWTTIVNSTSGPAGSYAWTVPNIPTTEALIRIENTSNACDYDESDAVFTIGSSVQVSAPNGGEAWQATVGEQSIPNATVQASNATLVLNTVNYTGNTSSYTQTLVPDNPLNKLRIQFTQVGGGYVRVYNGPSSSYPLLGTYYSTGTATSTHYTGALTVVSSLSSGTFDAFVTSVGTPTQNITWDITGTSEYFDIDYSTDGGATWKRIVNDYRQTGLVGSYDWQVPNVTTAQALIRVTDANNGVIVDQSDATFTINPADPVILVDSPNGGETWYQGQSRTIEWRTTDFNVGNVQIEFSRDLGATWELIAADYPNSGTYNWTVPTNITEAYPNCLMRVSKFDDLTVYDENDALFEIRPGIILESPNSNLTDWNGCTQSSITWYAGASSNYTIELSTDNGSTWNTIESSYTDGSFFVNYPWDVPNENSTECQVRVTDNSNPMFTDVSEVNFTIIPSIEITYPNVGGNYIAGDVLPVTWADTNSSFFYNIDYSIDNGLTWTNIVTNYNTTGGLYNWTLPAITEQNVLVRVTDFVDNCKLDVTDIGFSIAPSSVITVTSPNGGESLSGCTPHNITWTDSGSSGNVNIKYSSDGGATWNVVVNNIPSAPQSYSWNVPNLLSNDCVIRVEDALNLNTNFDHSNNVFSIDTSFTAEIASGGITQICAGDSVVLTSNSPTGNYWYPNGETTNSITVSNPGTYTLEVNNAGCISTSDDYVLTVNPLPSQPVISLNGPTTFCADEEITLSSSSAVGNYWLPNGETTSSITVNTSGTYSVVVTENGCSATSDTVVITVNPLPNAPVVTSNSIVPFGGTLNLNTDFGAGLTYEWLGPNGFTSALQNPSISNVTSANDGIYILSTQLNGCSSPNTYHTVGIGAPAQTINVSGNLATEIGEPIKLATADATDGTTTYTTLSDNAGNFNLDVGQYATYDLIPSKDNDNVITNGISTLDLILIQSHILGVNPLSSPYKILAADVNGSSSVTTFDMVLIRQLILGITNTYPNGQKWVFVDEGYSFPDPQVPFNYPNDITISSGVDLVDQDFIGIKLGDVSLDWDATVAKTADFSFYSQPDTVDLNEEFTFPVLVEDFSDLLGVQFTMEWPTQYFEYMNIADNPYGVNFSEHLSDNGQLTGSWFDPNVDPMTLSTGDTLFTMTFKVVNPFITEKISVNSQVTSAEGYNSGYGRLTLTDAFDNLVFKSPLGIDEVVSEEGFEVYPNPSFGIVNIAFEANQGDQVALRVIDAHGKLVKEYDVDQKPGSNTVTIDLRDEIVGISNGQVVFIVLEQNGVERIRKVTLL